MKTIHSFPQKFEVGLWNVKKAIALKGFQDTNAPEEDIGSLAEIMGCKYSEVTNHVPWPEEVIQGP